MHLHHYNGSIFLERNGKSVFAGGKTAENASEELQRKMNPLVVSDLQSETLEYQHL
jgi:hypothetical protein